MMNPMNHHPIHTLFAPPPIHRHHLHIRMALTPPPAPSPSPLRVVPQIRQVYLPFRIQRQQLFENRLAGPHPVVLLLEAFLYQLMQSLCRQNSLVGALRSVVIQDVAQGCGHVVGRRGLEAAGGKEVFGVGVGLGDGRGREVGSAGGAAV